MLWYSDTQLAWAQVDCGHRWVFLEVRGSSSGGGSLEKLAALMAEGHGARLQDTICVSAWQRSGKGPRRPWCSQNSEGD